MWNDTSLGSLRQLYDLTLILIPPKVIVLNEITERKDKKHVLRKSYRNIYSLSVPDLSFGNF